MPLPLPSLRPLSLSTHLSHNRHLKAPPPPSLLRTTIASLPPSLLPSHNLNVLDLVLLSSTPPTPPSHTRHVIATIWPLAALPPAHIALDDLSLSALQLKPVPMPESPSPRRGSKEHRVTPQRKRKGGVRRRSGVVREGGGGVVDGRLDGSPEVAGVRAFRGAGGREGGVGGDLLRDEDDGESMGVGGGAGFVCVERVVCKEEVGIARGVVLRLVTEGVGLEGVQSEEYRNMVQVGMRGRVVVGGMRMVFSYLGMDVVFEVVEVVVVGAGDGGVGAVIGRCDVGTAVRFLGEGEGESEWRLVWEGTGGLEREKRELESYARAAVGEVGSRGGVTGWRTGGALLYGPPGTGKTMMACAVGGKLGVAVEVLCGPEVLSEYVGEAVGNVERVFARARRRRPCVLVLDEVDAIAPKRDAAETDNVQRKVTAALLALMDGGVGMEGLFVVGTTNKVEMVDTAMRRAGRFDVEIEIGVPDGRGRGEILEGLIGKARAEGRVEVSQDEVTEVARVAYGFVGADLCALWRETASAALRRGGKDCVVALEDLRGALQRVQPSALREVSVEIPRTRWDDIGGKDEAKRRLKEAIEWPLSERGRKLFEKLGVMPPAGVLLFGPPGCSKTLLARAVATESGANFISVKGAELLSKYVGESEKAVRAIFRRARLAAPCVIFFDEVDALGGKRSGMSGASAQSRVVAQLLAEMDGIERDDFGAKDRVVVIAATNRPDCLDEAFLRPGRIDTQIYVGLPDSKERLAILEVHTRGMPLGEDVELEWVAGDKVTGGFSGAEVGGLVREAGMAAMERDVEAVERVERRDFERALERVSARTPRGVLNFFDEYINKVGGKRRGLVRIS